MDLTSVLNELGETSGRDALEPGWDISVSSCPDSLDFLTPEVFLENRAWTGLPKALEPLLEKTAETIQKRSSLRNLAWHTYRLAYQSAENRSFDAWPELDNALNGSGGVFYWRIRVYCGCPRDVVVARRG